ncbi:MAG TPA: dienelactone hydrolase family protein [Bryobacteraceae bacterium]|nr:dienelactone hydrolase family protein [Bryobacteraceae bacterium]
MRSALAVLAAGIALSQTYTAGPQVTTFFSEIDDTDQPYGLYLPRDFQAGKKYPLVISLHGASSNHRLNLRRVFGKGNLLSESDAEATRYFPPFRDVDYIVASPLARGTMGYQGIAEKDVYAVLAKVKRRYAIDEERIYLTGLSMGGGGTLWLGLTRPDIWAAIAPVCPAAPENLEELAGNAAHIPVKIFQGAIDPTVKSDMTRRWVQLLKDAGAKVEYVEYPGVRHNSWDLAYKDGAIFDWFDQHRLVRYPERVQFAARDYEHGAAYWVRFDALTAGTLARIDAKFTGKNAIVIQTEQLEGFTLQLKNHPLFSTDRPLTIRIDGTNLRLKARDSVSLVRGRNGWSARSLLPSSTEKGPGLEGPIAKAVESRHVYVYGTADSPSPEEAARRREVAAFAASWGTSKNPLLLTLPVLADAEVKEKDLNESHLILFGTRETNSLIAKYSARLPLELNAGAADYGLVYVMPVRGRYVVVNSGLPWWTRADQAKIAGWSFIPQQYKLLQTFGDYVLFKSGIDNVIAQGRFSAQWKLPREAAMQLTGSGVVTVR